MRLPPSSTSTIDRFPPPRSAGGARPGRQTVERGKYRLDFGIVRLASAVTGRIDITQQSKPVCERLAEEIGETVNIGVLQEHYAVNLYQVRGPGAVGAHNWVGRLTPPYATSSGKVLLAYLTAKERTELLASGMRKQTPRTITARTKLEKCLAQVWEHGYALALEELEIGLNAMAAPIRSRDGGVVAAISARDRRTASPRSVCANSLRHLFRARRRSATGWVTWADPPPASRDHEAPGAPRCSLKSGCWRCRPPSRADTIALASGKEAARQRRRPPS